MLEPLGIDPTHEKVYRTLLREPAADVAVLAKLLGDRGTLTSVLARLTELGLIRQIAGCRYVPNPPETAIGALIGHAIADLDVLMARAAELRGTTANGCSPANMIEVVGGAEEIRGRLLELMEAAHHVRVFEAERVMRPDRATPEAILVDVDVRGIEVRIVYSYRAVVAPEHLRRICGLAERGSEARLAPRLPGCMLVIDRRVAAVLTGAHRADILAIVHSPSVMLDALEALFAVHWETARRLGGRVRAHEHLTDDEVLMLQLLDAGCPDDAIAKLLGASGRTFHRRLQRIMVTLGVSTRFQAGREARAKGWLEPLAAT
jgi:DNA-binding CsgD family transcriptional regulator